MTIADQHPELEQAHDYAARRLDPSAAAAFEDHMLGCERCQTEVRLAVGLQQIVRHNRLAPSRRRVQWVAGTTALLAAGIAAFVVLNPGPHRDLLPLGQVITQPAYLGMSVRSSPKRGDSLFNTAMTDYNARRFVAAASGLRAALAAGVDSVPAEFFMASAELMAGHPDVAARDYARVIAAGPAAAGYLSDAHLYRAKALLQLGRADDALTELAIISHEAVNGARAASLADSVTRALRR